jgi:hypothetical protein
MAAWAEFSGRRTFPAADSRARCVLTDGWPVLSVHFSLGSARQVGQRTDNICRTVSSDFTLALFTIANHRQKPQIERRAAFCYTNPAKHFKLQTTVNPALIPKTYPVARSKHCQPVTDPWPRDAGPDAARCVADRY